MLSLHPHVRVIEQSASNATNFVLAAFTQPCIPKFNEFSGICHSVFLESGLEAAILFQCDNLS